MDSVWKKLRYFEPEGTNDNWGDPYAMDANLLLVLDDFRHFLGVPIYVTQGNGGKHSKNSHHYIKNGSCAVDVVIPDYKLDHVELLINVFRFPFTGVGYYPAWWWKAPQNIVGGLHLDTRPLKIEQDGTFDFKSSRWLGVPINGKQEYIGMTYQNIKTYGGKYGHFDRDLDLVSS